MAKVVIDFDLMTAEDMNDENSTHAFYSADDLMLELNIIYKAIKHIYPKIKSASHRPLAFDRLVVDTAISLTRACPFAVPPTFDEMSLSLRGGGEHLLASQIPLILACLCRVSLAIESAKVDYNCDTFAAPPLWNQRWEQLLAGVLRPAYIGHFLVLD